MAIEMTGAQLKSFVAGYVTSAKQAGAWNATTNNIYGLLDKIGKQITIDGEYVDKLPEFDGDELALGNTIEEWFVDLTLPVVNDATGAQTLAPQYPTVESCAYSYQLGKYDIPTTQPFANVEQAALSAQEAANMTGMIIKRLTDSYEMYKYAQKKQLLANFGTKAFVTGLKTVIAKPVDSTTGEAFIKQLKSDVEAASFANELGINGQLIGAAPAGALKLFVLKGVIPSLEVDTMAGAVQIEKLAAPCEIKVLDDFGAGVMTEEGGSTDAKVYAILVDTRGIKLHRDYHSIKPQENAQGDFVTFWDHSKNTGFISKNVFVKVYCYA